MEKKRTKTSTDSDSGTRPESRGGEGVSVPVRQGRDYLGIGRELGDFILEAVIEEAIDSGFLGQCERCGAWELTSELWGYRCEHCR